MARPDRASLPRAARARLLDIDSALCGLYEDGELVLSNHKDPLDEAVYIILSFQTDLSRFKMIWNSLREKYSDWNSVVCTTTPDLAATLKHGGLHRQKARSIKRLLKDVRLRFGDYSLWPLSQLSTEDAERALLGLTGISLKAARCVLLYSLDREVFPVDSNTFRVLKRTKVIPPDALYRRKSLHDALQHAVPASRRKSLHINLVMHGRHVCLPRRPLCSDCCLESQCPKVGVRLEQRYA